MSRTLVIGGGINGLTAAATLAKAGREVTVLEARETAGGLYGTYELAPGFRASPGPDLAGRIDPGVVRDLDLTRHGLELVPLDPIVYAPASDGRGLAIWRDTAKTVDAIRPLSAKDADTYPKFVTLVRELTDFIEPLLSKPPPTPDIRTGADVIELLKLGLGFKKLGTATMHELLRVLPMSISDFLDEWFENPLLKALLAGPSLEGVCLGPKSQGTAALFLFQKIFTRPAIAKGPGVAAALVGALEAAGGTLRTGCGVAGIEIEDGRVRGVTTTTGETLEATTVVSALSPRRTFFELADPAELPPRFVSELANIRYRGVTAKIHVALSEPPELAEGSYAGGVLQIGSHLDDLERAYDAVKYGEDSERPFLQVVFPSHADPSVAPSGQHLVSVLAQFAPSDARATDERVERVMRALGGPIPNLTSARVASDAWWPADYERELGLPDGSFDHGEMALDQLLFMRPVPGWADHTTPVENLFLAGPGCHPGGGLTCRTGAGAARRILSRG